MRWPQKSVSSGFQLSQLSCAIPHPYGEGGLSPCLLRNIGEKRGGERRGREGGREKGIHSPGSLPWCRVGQGAGPSSFTNNLCDLGKGRIGCPPGKAELEAERFPGSKAVVKRLRHFQHNHLKKWPGDRSPRIQNAGLRGGPGPRGRLAPLKCHFSPGISLRTRCLRCP